YRSVASRLKLDYSQFEELEFFSRLGTRLDAVSERIIQRGLRIREILKQKPVSPIPLAEQIAILLAVTEGLLDQVEPEHVALMEQRVRETVRKQASNLLQAMAEGHPLEDHQRERLLAIMAEAIQQEAVPGGKGHGGPAAAP